MTLNAKELIELANDIDKNCVDFAEWINRNRIGYHQEKKEWYVYDLGEWVDTYKLLDIFKTHKFSEIIKK